ncbi:MAG: hypothetical protein JJT78_04585 [Leptospira sp.]|nr:hypothetical protein [Leptospira sp.]
MFYSVVIRNRTNEDVEVSWQSSSAIESYRVVSRKILTNFLESWHAFVFKNSHSIAVRSKISQEKVFIQIQKELIEKSSTLESLLFGNLWNQEEILSNDSSSIDSFNFTTDLDWSGIPLEILSVCKEEFSPIALRFIVRRRIRSRNLPKKGKLGEGFLLWFSDGNQKSIQCSLIQEREDLEAFFDKKDINYSTFISSSFPSNSLIQKLNQVEYIHFAGHSEQDHIPFKDNSKLLWSDLGGLDLSNLKVAFFNSCYSGLQSLESTGIVASLLESGVSQFLGFSHVIDTEKAQKIGETFW